MIKDNTVTHFSTTINIFYFNGNLFAISQEAYDKYLQMELEYEQVVARLYKFSLWFNQYLKALK